MRWARLAAGVALFVASPVMGQVLDARPPRLLDQWVWSIGAFGGIPLGDFRKHENGGGGFELMAGVQPWRRQPLVIRAHLASLVYGTVDAQGYQDVCDFFGCRTDTVSYNARDHVMTSFHIGPEFFATDGFLRPFVYSMLGVTWFNSWANLQPASAGGPSEGSTSLFSSHNFSTAYGAGVRFVKTRFGREYGLELAARVNRNAKARYLTEDGVRVNSSNQWEVTPTQTAAHVLTIHVGFWMGPYINWNERRIR
ncbi:MAG TPA: hypothetical protein VF483_04990 [Gemmatimonadaceae bacterium]